ncbi:MAG: hypothetical protein JF888_15225 [Candidatus Dormibacteraeota bacterium]|uniref:Uncharacterized protein n=1 Tax=Candidatus Dormiibacter inghamiae TaxID=3127013 RepID=A0A934N888_9BACT|nr:hypothetical protein [Candidatus Dormibacteraeota bacterium]MBJ7606152.1 hypothetical protein [Candidatus Dormibacteraeota bacterium]
MFVHRRGPRRDRRGRYFSTFPGVWRRGDWIKIAPRGGAVIYGRSDSTINRMGVRMGSSELCRVVEELPEVLDSLVVPNRDGSRELQADVRRAGARRRLRDSRGPARAQQ